MALGLFAVAARWTTALVLGLAAVGIVSGLLFAVRSDQARSVDLPTGEVNLLVECLTDGGGPPGQGWVMVRILEIEEGGVTLSWKGPMGWLRGDVTDWRRTTRWWLTTVMRPIEIPSEHAIPGNHPSWEGQVSTARDAGIAGGRLGAGTAAIRSLILERLRVAEHPSRALLGGFLLGDTSHLGEMENNWMRRSGLSHFVAVSGSNVALFLGALFVVSGPLGWSSRRRAVLGILGLAFFVTLIGPDPSVVRAATMARSGIAGPTVRPSP